MLATLLVTRPAVCAFLQPCKCLADKGHCRDQVGLCRSGRIFRRNFVRRVVDGSTRVVDLSTKVRAGGLFQDGRGLFQVVLIFYGQGVNFLMLKVFCSALITGYSCENSQHSLEWHRRSSLRRPTLFVAFRVLFDFATEDFFHHTDALERAP